jgi:hypothetical protein
VAEIAAVFEGLAARLETIDGLRVREELPGTIQPPAAVLSLEELTYDTAMARGSDDLEVHVHVFTSLSSERAGQRALWAYLAGSGPKSVKAAVEADPTLGGAAMFAEVVSVGDVGIAKIGDVSYYAARFVVNVGVAG